MNPSLIILLLTGIAVAVFGILTFTGKTSLSKRAFHFSGIELDKSLTGIVFFFLGLLLIIAFLIVVVGPNFRKEGL